MSEVAMDNHAASMKIEYKTAEEKLIKLLEKRENRIMVLATSADNRVMARNILIASDRLMIYFFTWGHSRKCAQIRRNPRVALCAGKIGIEGEAKILGPMPAKENEKYLEIIRKKYPDAIKQWENKPGMILIEIKPVFACIDGYNENGETFIEYIDLVKKSAYKEKWAYY